MRHEELYEQVAAELSSGATRKGVWLRALTDADGDEVRARILYTRLRIADLQETAAIVGAAHAVATSPDQKRPAETVVRRVPENDAELYGVRGWLFWFCQWLKCFSPLFFAIAASGAYLRREQFSSRSDLVLACWTELLGWALIVCYGLWVGQQVWRGNPKGAAIARQYLRFRLWASAITLLLVVLCIRDVSNTQRFGWWVGGVLGTSMIPLCWLAYFRFSKRVQVTYGSARDSAPVSAGPFEPSMPDRSVASVEAIERSR